MKDIEAGLRTYTALGLAERSRVFDVTSQDVKVAFVHVAPGVYIELIEVDSHWSLTVRDDGRGMTLNPELYAQQGYGLNNMRERSGAIGGKFSIDSKPGDGTRVSVTLPRRKAVA